MDAGGTSPRIGEVDRAGIWRSRAMPGAIAEGRGEGGPFLILQDSPLPATSPLPIEPIRINKLANV